MQTVQSSSHAIHISSALFRCHNGFLIHPNMDKLPDSLIKHILRFIFWERRFKMCVVSKKWRFQIQSLPIDKRFNFRTIPPLCSIPILGKLIQQLHVCFPTPRRGMESTFRSLLLLKSLTTIRIMYANNELSIYVLMEIIRNNQASLKEITIAHSAFEFRFFDKCVFPNVNWMMIPLTIDEVSEQWLRTNELAQFPNIRYVNFQLTHRPGNFEDVTDLVRSWLPNTRNSIKVRVS